MAYSGFKRTRSDDDENETDEDWTNDTRQTKRFRSLEQQMVQLEQQHLRQVTIMTSHKKRQRDHDEEGAYHKRGADVLILPTLVSRWPDTAYMLVTTAAAATAATPKHRDNRTAVIPKTREES